MSARDSLTMWLGLLVLIIGSSLFIEVSHASCDCGFGTVATTTPYCSCTCTSGSGFAPPLCHYKTDEKQLIAFSLDATVATAYTSPEQFSSDMLTRRLQTAFGLSDTQGELDIVLRERVVKTADQIEQETEAQKSQFTLQVMIASSLVPSLLDGYYNTTKPSWVAEVGVLSIVVYAPLLPDESYTGLASSFVLGDLAGASISLNTLGWLIGCLILTAALLITDGVMLTVTDSERMDAKGVDADGVNLHRAASVRRASIAGGALAMDGENGEEPDELYMTDKELDAYRSMRAAKQSQSAGGGSEAGGTVGRGGGGGAEDPSGAAAGAPKAHSDDEGEDGVQQLHSETFSDLKKAPSPHPSPSLQASLNERPVSTSGSTPPTTPPHNLPRKSSLIHTSTITTNNGSESSPHSPQPPSSTMRHRGEFEKPPFLVDEEASLRHAGEGEIVDSTTSRTADAFRAKSPSVADRGPPSPSSPAPNVLAGSVHQDVAREEEFET